MLRIAEQQHPTEQNSYQTRGKAFFKNQSSTKMEIREDVVIVGGGIAGLATALALKRIGICSLVLERSHELRTTGAALTLFPNAWRALSALGVAHKISSLYPPLFKGYFTDVATGETRQVSLSRTEETDRSELGPKAVHRRILLEALSEELPADMIRFSAKLASIHTEAVNGETIAVLRLEDGTVIKAKAVIGCDGVHSVVAQWLGLSPPVDSGRSAVRGLSVYPQGHGYANEVQQYLAEAARAGVVPVSSTELYWFIAYEGEESSRDPELIKRLVMENKAKGFPQKFLDVVEHSELGSLTLDPLKLRLPWNLLLRSAHRANVTVAGDAMHPMTPDLGQGGCTALEDAVVLARSIGRLVRADGGLEWGRIGEALEAYVKERRWRVAGVIAGAYFMGRAQPGASGWVKKYFSWLTGFARNIFFRFGYTRILAVMNYDCGKLPIRPVEAASSKVD
ncbi:hypothetical protein H6P81_015607 [Aristolochia fimbriata]|uniref:FAD-binding domain-containing protein n=1 Tax=Aristolochia fimbriata TaxID=158543 RepID=A0AAV7E9T1_ARIFI|nr:hypothetical protein H6P81_015607 [Aristolochia fimbriata]